ncbi:hypothetical protein [Nannocystis pusilla]|uniref:hypothetical protein n=1 Tax=Nannocystis pusilla TaxID=889268 RepID=UPI003DA2EFF9
MRARLSSLSVAAIAAVSCFQVEPLPDCGQNAGEGGLYTPHYVCMPRAGAPLEISIAPRRLLRGDFDDEGVDNDFAVLLDLGRIQIHTTRDQKTELSAKLEAEGRVEAIAAARFFGEGHGDDLLGVTAGDKASGTAGRVFGFHNGGDMFASTSPEQFDAATLVPWGNCPAPNSIETLDVVDVENATGVAIGCDSGPPTAETPDEPLDGIVVEADAGVPFALQRRVGLKIPELTGIHAVNVAQLDGLGFEDIVAAHRPMDSEHESLAIYLVGKDAFTMNADQAERLDIPLTHFEIRRVLLDDLDGDGDVRPRRGASFGPRDHGGPPAPQRAAAVRGAAVLRRGPGHPRRRARRLHRRRRGRHRCRSRRRGHRPQRGQRPCPHPRSLPGPGRLRARSRRRGQRRDRRPRAARLRRRRPHRHRRGGEGRQRGAGVLLAQSLARRRVGPPTPARR